MSEPTKDTIYIDIDDEITSIIGKVNASPKEIIALVMPKRASMLQSIVNMKLLKRTAQKAKKRLVLITSEPSLLALAGTVGLHVAKNLQSKPTIPPIPDTTDLTDEISAAELNDRPLDPAATVGELAVTGGAEVETIEVDNSTPLDATANPEPFKDLAAPKPIKTKSDKKFKVPDFERFRKRLFLVILGLIVLLAGWFWAFVVAPKATVLVKTEGKDVRSTVEFTASTDKTDLDEANKLVPATLKELKKTDSEKVATTGQKDVGDRAKGTLTLKNCSQADGSVTIPAGTGASSGNFTFIISEGVTLPASVFSGGGTCLTTPKDVAVNAQNGGDQYNLSARGYTITGFPSVTASGTAMSGGTTKIIKVVSGSDIDNAKQKLAAKTPAVTEEIKTALTGDNLQGLAETLSSGSPTVSSAPNVGDEATDVTVTSTTRFTMLGVKTQDLKKLLEIEIGKQLDLTKQPIIDNGLTKAEYRLIDKKDDKHARMSFLATSRTGVQFDEASLKKEILGKKRGEIQSLIQSRPGVKEVEVKYRPFWVLSTPKSAKKITILFEQVNGSQ